MVSMQAGLDVQCPDEKNLDSCLTDQIMQLDEFSMGNSQKEFARLRLN